MEIRSLCVDGTQVTPMKSIAHMKFWTLLHKAFRSETLSYEKLCSITHTLFLPSWYHFPMSLGTQGYFVRYDRLFTFTVIASEEKTIRIDGVPVDLFTKVSYDSLENSEL